MATNTTGNAVAMAISRSTETATTTSTATATGLAQATANSTANGSGTATSTATATGPKNTTATSIASWPPTISPRMLFPFMFPALPPIWMIVMSAICFTSLAHYGFEELKGKNIQFSKFSNFQISAKARKQLSGKTGMLLAYAPAFVAALTFLLFFSHHNNVRILLLSSALTLYFFKRLLEVHFVHKYSGGMGLDAVILISLCYFLATTIMIYGQILTLGIPEPTIDLMKPGIILFLIGISGNFYHHLLLSRVRSKASNMKYKMPKGGLFELVICPHYFFEVMGFLGVSFISQTLFPFSFTMGSAIYFTGRSFATMKWYRSNFMDFPKNIKAIVPYVL